MGSGHPRFGGARAGRKFWFGGTAGGSLTEQVTPRRFRSTSGKRLGNLLDGSYQDHDARQVAREAAQRLARTGEGGPDPRFILETAMQLAQRIGDSPVPARSPHRVRDRANERSRAVSIRRRIPGEQDAVAECMRLAREIARRAHPCSLPADRVGQLASRGDCGLARDLSRPRGFPYGRFQIAHAACSG